MAYPSLFDQAKLGNVYMACNQAEVTLTGLATTMTGLGLMNPAGSGKNLHLLTAMWCSDYPGTAKRSVGIATAGVSTSAQPTTNAVQILNSRLISTTSSGGSVALATSGATMVGATPVMVRMLYAGAINLGTNGQSSQFVARDDVDGAIIIPPGGSIQLAFVTTADTGLGSFVWMELGL
jgi:hypothetical protein